MLGPFITASRRKHSPGVACASMSTTTTTTARDRGDRYGPMEWAQSSTTRNSAMAEGPRDALVSRNSATPKYPYRMESIA